MYQTFLVVFKQLIYHDNLFWSSFSFFILNEDLFIMKLSVGNIWWVFDFISKVKKFLDEVVSFCRLPLVRLGARTKLNGVLDACVDIESRKTEIFFATLAWINNLFGLRVWIFEEWVLNWVELPLTWFHLEK